VRSRAARSSTLEGLDVKRRAIAPAGQNAVLVLEPPVGTPGTVKPYNKIDDSAYPVI